MSARLGLSIIDQAVVSAFNFGMNLYFLKLWIPNDFGLFAVITATAIFATMIQNAAINTPLAVHLPIVSSENEAEMLRRVFSAANLLLIVTVLIMGVCGLTVWLNTSQPMLIVSGALYMATQLMREYYRGLLAIESKLRALLFLDIAYVALAAGTLFYFYAFNKNSPVSVSLVLFILSTAALFTSLSQYFPLSCIDFRTLRTQSIEVFKKQIHEIRWSLFGVITTDLQNRGYLFVAAAVFGPSTVAHLQAGRIFYGPLNLMSSAWARIARPQLAGLLGKGDLASFAAQLKKALCFFVLFNVLFLFFLWCSWPYLSLYVFAEKYKGLEITIALWGIVNIIFQVRSCIGIGVQALRKFRELTFATIYGAIVSSILVGVACGVQKPDWLIASVLGGELVAIVVITFVLRKNILLSSMVNHFKN